MVEAALVIGTVPLRRGWAEWVNGLTRVRKEFVMTLAEWMVFGIEKAVEEVLKDLHEYDHDERALSLEAARQLELIADAWRIKEVEATEARAGQ